MNQAQSVLLKLLRCARCQKTAVGDPETDRSAVFTEASIQTVTALAAKALPSTSNDAERTQRQNAQYVMFAHLSADMTPCGLLWAGYAESSYSAYRGGKTK